MYFSWFEQYSYSNSPHSKRAEHFLLVLTCTMGWSRSWTGNNRQTLVDVYSKLWFGFALLYILFFYIFFHHFLSCQKTPSFILLWICQITRQSPPLPPAPPLPPFLAIFFPFWKRENSSLLLSWDLSVHPYPQFSLFATPMCRYSLLLLSFYSTLMPPW